MDLKVAQPNSNFRKIVIWILLSHIIIILHSIKVDGLPFAGFAILLFWTSVYERRRAGNSKAVKMLTHLGPFSTYIPLCLIDKFW